MREASLNAHRLTTALNGVWREPEEQRALLSEITGEAIDPTVSVFPPFYTDFGRNLHLGKNVFINAGCHFQDQGGIFIDDGALIGHNVIFATIDHDLDPGDRRCRFAPIRLGKNVWIGSGAIITKGVTIGELYDAIEHELPDGFTKGKLQYAMTRLWADDLVKVEGKVNTYARKA
jgi:acetyltransferase-like isoleucine patch superfamily enzyme